MVARLLLLVDNETVSWVVGTLVWLFGLTDLGFRFSSALICGFELGVLVGFSSTFFATGSKSSGFRRPALQ